MKWYDVDMTLSKRLGNGKCIRERAGNSQNHMGAEYRFVPVHPKAARALVQPGDAACPLSHARPLPGGFSGRVEFDLVAETSVIFGQKKKEDDLEITVHARLRENGPLAAPGRAIKGLVRNVFGIATFSHFSPVNGDHRFFSRNMDYLDAFAEHRRGKRPKLGWLRPRQDENGKFVWSIYLMEEYDPRGKDTNIPSAALVRIFNNILKKNISSRGWNEKKIKNKHMEIGKIKDEEEYKKLCRGRYLVVSGFMVKKRKETLFPLPPPPGEGGRDVDDTAINAFLFANSKYAKTGAEYPVGGKRVPDGNFALFLAEYLYGQGEDAAGKLAAKLGWKWEDVEHLAQRRDKPPGIPVYCWGDPSKETFEMGTSQVVPRGPEGSVADFLDPGTQEPLSGGILDWADALFGRVEDEYPKAQKASLKSRLSFDFALADGEELCGDGHAVKVKQGQPKASFDPFYLKRKEADKGPAAWAKKEFAALSGYKRYPACRSEDLPPPEPLPDEQPDGMDNFVRPLKRGTVYHCGVEFHNLHPLELGALLWAISFGDPEVFTGGETRFRHVAGRLRNRGLGRLRPADAKLKDVRQNPMPEGLRWRDVLGLPGESGEDAAVMLALTLMRAFEAHMGRFLADDDTLAEDEARQKYYDNESITALLNSSDATWDSQAHGHDARKMFHIPAGDEKFRYFNALRRMHYRKYHEGGGCAGEAKQIMPGEGKTTILDEFLTPRGGPLQGPPPAGNPPDAEGPAAAAGDATPQALRDPAAALKKWLESPN